jgi:hypothetical protein
VADDQIACRNWAQQLRQGHVEGIIVPSASLPGTENVILFGERVSAPYLLRPIDPVDQPVSIAAEDARTLTSLVSIIRYRGDSHPALVAYERGARFDFQEPSWTRT